MIFGEISVNTTAITNTPPFWDIGIGVNPPFVSIFGDDMICIWAHHIVASVIILRIKKNGDYCFYMDETSYRVFGSHIYGDNWNYSGAYMRDLGNGNYFVYNGNGGYCKFLVPNYFVSGGKIVIPTAFSVSAAPCSPETPAESFFDLEKNIYLQTWYKSYGASSDWWASVYLESPTGSLFLTGGLLGNSSANPASKIGYSLPPYQTATFDTKTGLCWYGNSIKYSTIGQVSLNLATFGYASTAINYESLACGGAGNSNTFAYLTKQKIFNVADIPNFSAANMTGNNQAGVSDIPGLYLMAGKTDNTLATDAGLVFNDQYAFRISMPVSIYAYAIWADGSVIHLTQYDANGGVTIRTGNLNEPNLSPPSIKPAHYPVMANFARPVSALGLFKT